MKYSEAGHGRSLGVVVVCVRMQALLRCDLLGAAPWRPFWSSSGKRLLLPYPAPLEGISVGTFNLPPRILR